MRRIKWDDDRTKVDQTCTIIPAEPGFFVVEKVHGDDGEIESLDYMPVLAWAITVEVLEDRGGDMEHKPGLPIPITVDGAEEGAAAIRAPSGRISVAMENDFDDEASALEYLKQQEKKLRELQAKQSA
jgi:hypothetical protein